MIFVDKNMELFQIVGLLLLVAFGIVSILKLIDKNKKQLLEEMLKNKDISQETFFKYLNK